LYRRIPLEFYGIASMESSEDVEVFQESREEESSLLIEIADAMSEKDKVNFTIHTKTTLPTFKSHEMSVTRSHEDFVWLHEQFEDSSDCAGIIIPPCPPRPDFEASREKLLKLTESEGTLTEDELSKMKASLEAEYLATFKKTVAMHDVFLKRVSAHPNLRACYNLRVFLEFTGELGVRTKTRSERFGSYLQRSMSDGFSMVVATAATHSTNMDDIDEDTELKQRRDHLQQYCNTIRPVVSAADRMTITRCELAEPLIFIHTTLHALGELESPHLTKFCLGLNEMFEKMQKTECRIASDEDLKLSDTMRYYRDESQAALSLLQRRLRALQDYAVTTKNLERARTKNKDVAVAEKAQNDAYEKLKNLTNSGRKEINDYRLRRVDYFKRSLIGLTELEIRNNTQQLELLKTTLNVLKPQTVL
jgi:sorting nexin-5/6/32